MQTNEILHRVATALSLDITTIQEIYTLASYPIETQRVQSILKLPAESGSQLCSYEELGIFLDGLILLKRGPSPRKQNDEATVALTNNLILKKLRIALNLKEIETEMIFGLADVELSKQQLSSLFRKEGHKNFAECSDALLLAFLEGLDEFYYVGDEV